MNTPQQRNAASAGYENGAYQGRADREAVERLRRIEIRVNKFMRHMGFNPVDQADNPRVDRVLVDGRDLICSSPNVTLGDISSAANAARITGKCRVFIGSNYWGEVTV